MFYINEAHRKNYESLLKFYESSLPNIEYEVACYVLALPEVLKRIPENYNVEFPFDWAWKYENGQIMPTNALFFMDDPYKQLVIAANHMYNSEPFPLNRGLEHWDKIHFEIFIQACKIRGEFQ
ncbi:DUF2538 family protein [Paenibacillus terrae]|uniref:Uncharacterized protein n=1 Tax=Paenibacillus terrae TaxID=159743 RepID=A0A0D7WVQ4_9BACL|nr:DUF2538 family protein [Paenibacillus terrae]KJD42798.1 hypothetical protein QD47_26255 [Paenibacillus terrae]